MGHVSAPPLETARPGTCAGSAEPCVAPELELLDETAPAVTCDFPEGSPGRVEWSMTLDRIECPLGECQLGEPTLAPGPAGEVWAVATVTAPVKTDQGANTTVLGFALLRYDSEGRRTVAMLSDYRTRLAGILPNVPGGMRVDARGHLLWIAPMSSEPGVELREYDESGELVRRQPLVRGILSATAGTNSGGDVLLTYAYDPPFAGVPDSGSVLDDTPGNAFDAAGLDTERGVRWNVPLSTVFRLRTTDRLPQTFPTEGGLYLRAFVGATLNPAYTLIARLSAGGTVEWARRTPSSNTSILALDDGGFLFLNSIINPENSETITKFDRDGRAGYRLNPHLLFAIPSQAGPLGTLRTSFAGHAWGSASSGDPVNGVPVTTVFFSLSDDGEHCWRSPPLETPACDTGSGFCSSLRLSPAKGGRIFVGGSKTIALVRFEDVAW